MSQRKTAVSVTPPVLFVHGMWLHASSWQNWVDLFATEGYDAVAPGWPGEHATVEQTRANPSGLAGLAMERLVTHYADLIRDLPAQPILIGHSLGGTVVQKLLAAGYGVGGAVLDAARFDGELPGALGTLRVALPELAHRDAIDQALSLTDYQFRFAFGRHLDADASDAHFRDFAIPAPVRLLIEPETAGISLPPAPGRKTKPAAPLLFADSAGAGARATTGSLVGGRRALYTGLETDAQSAAFADRGASFIFDAGWRDVAETVLDWVQERFGTARIPAGNSRGRAVLRGTAA